MWVRGLKLSRHLGGRNHALSHPMWVRGLKHNIRAAFALDKRRILCGCVD